VKTKKAVTKKSTNDDSDDSEKAIVVKTTKAATKKSVNGERLPSPYNQYMKDNLTKYKRNHPNLDHKAAFTAVAGMWATAPENSNRK
jgi:hypothetical protein